METILSILIPVTYLALFALERIFPARPLPKVSWWVLKGFVAFVLFGAFNAIVPAIIADQMTRRVTPVNLQFLGLGGILVVLVASDMVSYWVHRFLHRVPFVWRWTHQMHHSAERLDVAGSAYFHPFDAAVQIGAPTMIVALLGITPDAAALAGFIGFFLAVFQHANVKTPRWLGYLILRPEQHSIHHQRGVHAYNYGNFAFMDLVFGTFRNPEGFSAEQGFWDGASAKMGSMLIGRDVSEPSEAASDTNEAWMRPQQSL